MTAGQTIRSIKGVDPIAWRRRVGRMHSRNNILAWKDDLILSTSGEVWNEPDEKDGITCIDGLTGKPRWFLPTGSDANELHAIQGTVICGTDGGDLLAIDAETGVKLASYRSHSPFIARALSITAGGEAAAVSLSVDGEVLAYLPSQRVFKHLGSVPGLFRANPVSSGKLSEKGLLVAATEAGLILEIDITGDLKWRELHQIEAAKPSDRQDFLLTLRGIGSLVIEEDLLVISYARVTMDETPPIRAIRVSDGTLVWKARAVKTVSKKPRYLGNSRVTPVIWNRQIITTLGYSDSLFAFSLDSGAGIWKLRLDDGYFQNWASPALHGDRLYVARINGVLVTVDLVKRAVIKSVSVELPFISRTNDRDLVEEEKEIWGKIPWPELQVTGLAYSGPAVGQPLVAGLVSSPLHIGSRVYLGTVSGDLCAIEDVHLAKAN